jgi:NAD+ kinase
VLGVNTGKLGFLAPFTLDELDRKLDGFLKNGAPTEPRMMLECALIRKADQVFHSLALNEAAITGAPPSRLHWVDVAINDQLSTSYRGDGIIIATPVGSTGHSLGTGGPLVVPTMEAIIVSPLCPHTFAGRSLVIPPGETLRLSVRPPVKGVGLTVDGQDWIELADGDTVTVRKAPKPLVVVPGDKSFFQMLTDKFYWGGHPNYVY